MQAVSKPTYERVRSEDKNHFLWFPAIQGLNGQKVDVIADKGAQLADDLSKKSDDKELQAMMTWYKTVEAPYVNDDQKPVNAAVIHGGRSALKVTSGIPVAMAIGYLLLVLYFMSRGGYKAVHLDSSGREIEVAHTAEEEIAIEAMGTKEA